MGKRLNGYFRIEMASLVCKLVINICGQDSLVWIFPSCCHGPIYESFDACSKHAREKGIFFYSTVDGCYQAPLITLVLGQAVIRDYLPVFLDCVLILDFHGRHQQAWDAMKCFEGGD